MLTAVLWAQTPRKVLEERIASILRFEVEFRQKYEGCWSRNKSRKTKEKWYNIEIFSFQEHKMILTITLSLKEKP
jgi:hypothetical protein